MLIMGASIIFASGIVYTTIIRPNSKNDSQLAENRSISESQQQTNELEAADMSPTEQITTVPPTAENASQNSTEVQMHNDSTNIRISNSQSSTGSNNTNNTSINVSVSNNSEESGGLLEFRKGGIGLEGDNLHVSATMNLPSSGTCTFTFTLNGTVRVQQSNHIADSKTCELFIAKSAFPKSATYLYTIDFVSDDGQATAHQAESEISIY